MNKLIIFHFVGRKGRLDGPVPPLRMLAAMLVGVVLFVAFLAWLVLLP